MDYVNDYLAKAKDKQKGKPYRVDAIHCKRGGSLSVQGNDSVYCSPKTNDGPYSTVEVLVNSPRMKLKSFGKPSQKFDDGARLWGFLSVDKVNAEIAKRGGIAN